MSQGPDTPPLPRRERLLLELPAAALLLLALVQIALSFTLHLSPWKGGGFGMFSTNEHGSFRNVRVYALAPGGERRLAIPPDLLRRELAVRELPSPGALRGLAAALAGEAPGAEALRAEVWQVEFDASLRPSRRKLAEAVWRAP